jgi:hypothetical protein
MAAILIPITQPQTLMPSDSLALQADWLDRRATSHVHPNPTRPRSPPSSERRNRARIRQLLGSARDGRRRPRRPRPHPSSLSSSVAVGHPQLLLAVQHTWRLGEGASSEARDVAGGDRIGKLLWIYNCSNPTMLLYRIVISGSSLGSKSQRW